MVPLPQSDWGPWIRKLRRDEPPELFYFTYSGNGRELLGPASDVWRAGIILRHLMLMKPLGWIKLDNPLDLYRSMRSDSNHPEPDPKKQLAHLAWEMTRPIPTERISVDDALKRLDSIA